MSSTDCVQCEQDCYAVIGNPIEHSKSPLIHKMFADQTGQALRYDALLSKTDSFAQSVAAFLIGGGKGLNVTVPFKQEAWQIADTLSDRAKRAGAVNTLVLQEKGELFGDNTDGIGLVRDLTDNLGITLENKTILILGAGGAARGVLANLLEQKPARLVIANRTVERAEELADLFSDLGNTEGCGFDALGGSSFDLIINATAAGLTGQVPELPGGIINNKDLQTLPEGKPLAHESRLNGSSDKPLTVKGDDGDKRSKAPGGHGST